MHLLCNLFWLVSQSQPLSPLKTCTGYVGLTAGDLLNHQGSPAAPPPLQKYTPPNRPKPVSHARVPFSSLHARPAFSPLHQGYASQVLCRVGGWQRTRFSQNGYRHARAYIRFQCTTTRTESSYVQSLTEYKVSIYLHMYRKLMRTKSTHRY